MVFSSIPFIFFFLTSFLLLYYLVPFKVKNILLLIYSLIFYAWGEPIYIILMLFTTLVDYSCGRLIEKYPSKKKIFIFFSIIIDLGLIGFFKYSDFLINNINHAFYIDIPLLNLGLPIGISFYTFQTMSYSIDVYRGDIKAEKNYFTFLTYLSMFPQLIAGPIVRYETVAQELHHRETNFTNFSLGLVRFLNGLFKKMLIANNIGLLWSIISTDPSNAILTAWLGLIAFAFQIYFDFSGYSDMAIGMGKMLGFNYLENFNYPYIAKSITDFWRRWHMSLSTWFRDYVYIPLGGSRTTKVKNIRNILIVWTLTGIWHGAAWNFIIWGLYFGVILILEKFVLKKYLDKLPSFFQHTYALMLILIGWLIFGFDDVNLLKKYALSLLGLNNNPLINNAFIFYFTNYFLLIIIACLFSIPTYNYLKEKIKLSKFNKIYYLLIAVIYIVLFIITISFLVSDTYNPFLYFRF